jgi:hypothetical protein
MNAPSSTVGERPSNEYNGIVYIYTAGKTRLDCALGGKNCNVF